jgi:hypothetical protein
VNAACFKDNVKALAVLVSHGGRLEHKNLSESAVVSAHRYRSHQVSKYIMKLKEDALMNFKGASYVVPDGDHMESDGAYMEHADVGHMEPHGAYMEHADGDHMEYHGAYMEHADVGHMVAHGAYMEHADVSYNIMVVFKWFKYSNVTTATTSTIFPMCFFTM